MDSLYINKANDRTSPAADAIHKEFSLFQRLTASCKYKLNQCSIALKATESTGFLNAISYIFIKAFQSASEQAPGRPMKAPLWA